MDFNTTEAMYTKEKQNKKAKNSKSSKSGQTPNKKVSSCTQWP